MVRRAVPPQLLLLAAAAGLLACGAASGDVAAPAEDMTAIIHGRVNLPGRVFRRGSGVRLVVDGQHGTYVRVNGTFVLQLQPGSHIVDFAVRDVILPQLRIDVSRKTKGKYRAIFNDKYRNPLQEPLEVDDLGKIQYYEQHEEINWLGFLRNPMVMMMLLPAGMAFLMPMLVDQEEMKQQMREMSPAGGGGNPMEVLKNAWQQNKEQLEQEQQQRQRQVQPPRPGQRRSVPGRQVPTR